MVWNPNSLDNSKILLEPLYQASERHITKNWLISVFKIISYVPFASHSKKGIIILELEMHEHLGITKLLWVGGIPLKRQSCSAIHFSQRGSGHSRPSHTPTHTQGQAFPSTVHRNEIAPSRLRTAPH